MSELDWVLAAVDAVGFLAVALVIGFGLGRRDMRNEAVEALRFSARLARAGLTERAVAKADALNAAADRLERRKS